VAVWGNIGCRSRDRVGFDARIIVGVLFRLREHLRDRVPTTSWRPPPWGRAIVGCLILFALNRLMFQADQAEQFVRFMAYWLISGARVCVVMWMLEGCFAVQLGDIYLNVGLATILGVAGLFFVRLFSAEAGPKPDSLLFHMETIACLAGTLLFLSSCCLMLIALWRATKRIVMSLRNGN